MSLTPSSTFPDSGLVFDTLLRRDKFEPHPAGISSLFFAFANLVIHSIFDTNHQDCTLNNASSYLDLSPLYGSSPETANQLRRRDGTGKLWEDVFADGRLLLMPPSVCALLVLLCRNHNVRPPSSLVTIVSLTDYLSANRRENSRYQRTRYLFEPSPYRRGCTYRSR